MTYYKQLQMIIILTLTLLSIRLTSNTNCESNCAECENFSNCVLCAQKYFLTKINQCMPCPEGCRLCSLNANQQIECSQCLQRYQLSAKNECFVCSPQCYDCSMSSRNCTACKVGYKLQNSTCVAQDACSLIPNCRRCAYDGSKYYCIECKIHFTNFGGGCQACPTEPNSTCKNCIQNKQHMWFLVQLYIPQLMKFSIQTIKNNTATTNRLLQSNSLQKNIQFPKLASTAKYVYREWTLQDWNNASWTNYTFPNIQNVTFKQYLGWVQVMVFLFTITQIQVINKGSLELISQLKTTFYRCLPIIQPISLIIDETSSSQWQQITTYANNLASHQWNGLMLKSYSYNKFQSILSMSYIFYAQSCVKCDDYKILDENRNCIPCPKNCEICQISGSGQLLCTSCMKGYYSPDGRACQQCDSDCVNCQQSNGHYCTECASGQVLDFGKCTLCYYPCDKCVSGSPTECLTCKPPFSLYPNTANKCYTCNDPNCNICDESNNKVCYDCISSYTALQNSCVGCPANCLKCQIVNNSSICYKCTKKYSLVSGVCQACGSKCLHCLATNISICLECQDYNFVEIISGKCKSCPGACPRCTSLSECWGQYEGYVSFRNTSIKCPTGCAICSQMIPNFCQSCSSGYSLSGSSFNIVNNQLDSCQKCAYGCKTCLNQTYCTSCLNSFGLINNYCTHCNGSCNSCSEKSGCLSCIVGYTYNNGTCQIAIKLGCLIFDNNGSCAVCENGYALRNDGVCIKCASNCPAKCDPQNITKCLSCMTGYYLSGFECKLCPFGCSVCTADGKCSSCISFFTYNESSSSCMDVCVYPCLDCSSKTACLSCYGGYELIGTNCMYQQSFCTSNCEICLPGSSLNFITLQCYRCPQNCGACSSQTCNACFDGFYLFDNAKCLACPTECFTCYDGQNCKTCSPGYVQIILQGGIIISQTKKSVKCVKCDQNCAICHFYKQNCLLCNDGFYLKNTKCINTYTVQYEFKINYNYTEFLKNGKSYQFVTNLFNQLNLNVSNNYIDYIKQGSTVIGGTIATNNQTQANTIQSNIANISNINNFSLLSSSSYVAMNGQPVSATQTSASNTPNIGVIVGSVIGGVVFLAIIGGIIWRVLKNKNAKKKQNAQNKGTVKSKQTNETNQNGNNTNKTFVNLSQNSNREPQIANQRQLFQIAIQDLKQTKQKQLKEKKSFNDKSDKEPIKQNDNEDNQQKDSLSRQNPNGQNMMEKKGEIKKYLKRANSSSKYSKIIVQDKNKEENVSNFYASQAIVKEEFVAKQKQQKVQKSKLKKNSVVSSKKLKKKQKSKSKSKPKQKQMQKQKQKQKQLIKTQNQIQKKEKKSQKIEQIIQKLSVRQKQGLKLQKQQIDILKQALYLQKQSLNISKQSNKLPIIVNQQNKTLQKEHHLQRKKEQENQKQSLQKSKLSESAKKQQNKPGKKTLQQLFSSLMVQEKQQINAESNNKIQYFNQSRTNISF